MVTARSTHDGAQNDRWGQLWLALLIITLSCCSPATRRTPAGTADEALGAAVRDALAADSRITAVIDLTVHDGIVEAAGAVASVDEARRVLRRIGEVDGVRGLVNRLRVVPHSP